MDWLKKLKSLKENVGFFLDPTIVSSLEKDFDGTKEEQKQQTTEFGGDDEDIKDINVVNATHFIHPFTSDTKSKDIDHLLITYRKMAEISYVENAIDQIIQDAVILDETTEVPVKLDFNDPNDEISGKLRDKIIDEFSHLLDIMDFDDQGDDIFKQWFVDGRLLVQTIIDKDKNKRRQSGILKTKIISPLFLKRQFNQRTKKYIYIYDDGKMKDYRGKDVIGKVPEELIVFVPSGKWDIHKSYSVSRLHTAIKDVNRLDILEDHMLIYRVVRAPERRVFYIDPGNIPPKKQEAYLEKIISKFKQNKVFDKETGTINAKTAHRGMLEDFFLLRKEGKGTEITTIGNSVGGLGEIQDLFFFERKAFKALKVPWSRNNFEDRQQNVVLGSARAEDITREELQFAKYISHLRKKFNILWFELLKRQLIYKNIIKKKEWESIKRKLKFLYKTNTEWVEAKKLANLEKRLDILTNIEEQIGKWFTRDFVHKQLFNRTDADIKELQTKLQEEKTKFADEEESA